MNKIKNIILFSFASVLLLAMTGCDAESPMDKDLYPQKVYIVGAKDKIVDRDLDIGLLQDTISVSIAVSGSRASAQDVVVSVEEAYGAIEYYNERELSAEVTHYQKLHSDIYTYPQSKVTIKAGEIYNTYPVYIQPATLHCDSLYMLALQLKSPSAYELNEEDSVALVRINLTNQYSGLYYMDGLIKNTVNPDDSLSYKMPRTAVATDNGNTIRIYHYNNEFHNGDANDYRPTHTFKITVNDDNSLTLVAWDQFDLVNGGGRYIPEWKTYDIWYEYNAEGTVYHVAGYLYKERKTSEEQRLIDNWIEEQRGI
jgi:hypothetical protein